MRTTRSHICGAFSYDKALPNLTNTVQLQLSESYVRTLYYHSWFKDPESGHKEWDMKGLGIFHFSTNVLGMEYVSGGDTACQGVSVVVDGKKIDRECKLLNMR